MSAAPLALPRRRLRRAAGIGAALALAILLAWGAGFLWFLRIAAHASAPPAEADGIVALTGGAERIETALHLLAEGRARLLLVSGVARGTDLPDLARRAGLDPAPLASRVTLGRQAISTRGNGSETAAWARAHGMRSLIVVTAAYHMPRALTEIARALPDVILYPVAVLPPALRGARDADAMRLLASEYNKWLAAEVGLSFLSRGHQGA